MSFFEELKRRNVFRVGIAYLVGAWLIIQLADILLDNIGAPPWVLQSLFVVLAVGFFIAAFFAWAFELTPEGVKRETEVDRTQSITHHTGKKLNNAILVLLALAVAYLLFDKFSDKAPVPVSAQSTPAGAESPGQEADATPEAPEISRQSIAVLPFANRSRNEDDEFFVEGVHDDLLTNLARISSLKVISRTSVLRFKGTERPIPEIAQELGVATVMEGAVQRSGNQIRINVQLIDADTDEHLWAEIFDREMTAENLFAIQSEISEKIADALEATLSPEEQQRISDKPTENLAAYHAYMRGRQLMALRTSTDLEQAYVEFERAVELDPEFALAWVGISETAFLLSSYGTMPIPEAYQRMGEAVARALELNDQLGEAYLSLAEVHGYHERWADSEAAYRKAIELSPGYATAYQWYADFLNDFPHRLKEAESVIARGVELDPLSSIIRLNQIANVSIQGRFSEAETQLKELLELDPGFAPAYSVMAGLMGSSGRYAEQVMWQRKSSELDPGRIQLYIGQAFALVDMGNVEALAGIRQAMDDIDDQHWSTGWVDVMDSLYRQNYSAALESVNWVGSQIGPVPSFQEFLGYVHILNSDYQKASEAFKIADPRFFERSNWRAAIEQDTSDGCVYAWVMMHAGEEAMGQDLLEQTLAYLTDELPGYIEHADRYGYPDCYAIRGDYAKAMDAFQTQVDHGHSSFWWVNTRLPYFDPLRGEPRFEATMATLRQKSAEQREKLAELEAAAGP